MTSHTHTHTQFQVNIVCPSKVLNWQKNRNCWTTERFYYYHGYLWSKEYVKFDWLVANQQFEKISSKSSVKSTQIFSALGDSVKWIIFFIQFSFSWKGQLKGIANLEQVGITTNGLMLTRLLVPMQRAGLDAINISLDTLNASKYETITRRKGFERVLAGIDLAIQLGYTPKLNCVVMNGFNDSEICDFVEMTRGKNIDVRFIEYMPFTGNRWETEKMITFRWVRERMFCDSLDNIIPVCFE